MVKFHFVSLIAAGVMASYAAIASGEPSMAATTGEPVVINPDSIDRLLMEAQGHNPGIAEADARVDAATAAVDSVRKWEDPVFTVGLSLPTKRGFKSSEEGDILYGIQQKLPLFDRPKVAREAAEAEAAKEKLNVSYETQKLRRDLTLALINLALADETLVLEKQDIEWIESTLSAVDQRYRVGKATQVEWLKMQTAKAKALDHLKTLELEREHQQVSVNRLLNRDLHAPWPLVKLAPVQPSLVESDALINTAVQAEPKLKVMQQEIAQAEAMTRVTKQQRQPDIGVGLQGRNYSGDGGLREGMLTVSFTLPWLNARRYDSDFQRDRAKVRASELEATDYTLNLREELHHFIVDMDAARRQVLLYRDELIPLTAQTLTSAQAAWENNLGLLQDVLEARRMLVENRLMLAEGLADQGRNQAELCLRTGRTDLTAFIPLPIMTTPMPPRDPMAMPGKNQ